jgi:hypothetical protein
VLLSLPLLVSCGTYSYSHPFLLFFPPPPSFFLRIISEITVMSTFISFNLFSLSWELLSGSLQFHITRFCVSFILTSCLSSKTYLT